MNNEFVKVIPLGGLSEIGKNITAIEYDNEIVVIDCGIAFPDEEMYGVDAVIPDITYLLENSNKVKAFFLTHGHEDHIGALPYILKQLNVPVYGTALTLGIVKNKLEEHKILSDCSLRIVTPGDSITFSKLSVEFIRNTHSIADSCSLAINTPEGTIIHTGDFKIDYTPIDGLTMDLQRISDYGKKGVLLLMADSTNVNRNGHSLSEKSIGKTFDKIFSTAKGRIIVSTFASNIHRMQQIINASLMFNRKVTFSGRSMENISKVALELGYLNIPEGFLIDIDEINNYPPERLTIITTGSQGEPMAALARIAYSSHRKIVLLPNDLIILSSSPIPGNEKLISRIINQLLKKGAEVIYKDLEDVHVSGHACKEELKLIHNLVKPKFFLPVHGEYRHLKHHIELAEELGMEKEHSFIIDTGDILALNKDNAAVIGRVKTGSVYVDGLGVGDVGSLVIRDRKNLAQDGMINIVVTIHKETHSIIAGPDIITRGFVYAKNSEELIKEIKSIANDELNTCLENKILEWYVLKNNVKRSVDRFVFEKTKRRPIVLPIIMEI